MPLYDYECDHCGHVFEDYTEIAKRNEMVCPECKSSAKLVIRHYRNQDWFRPHWNENIALEPIYVRTKGHFKELLKDHGLYCKALGPIEDKRGC